MLISCHGGSKSYSRWLISSAPLNQLKSAHYIGVFNAGTQTSPIKASLSSIISPIILFGCPKCALLNPTQAPPKAKATRSKGSLASVAVQSFCPVPYTRRRATPPSESRRRLVISWLAKQPPRTANCKPPAHQARCAGASVRATPRPGTTFEVSKGPLAVLRSQPKCHGPGKAAPSASRPRPRLAPSLRRSPPPARLLPSLKPTCSLFRSLITCLPKPNPTLLKA